MGTDTINSDAQKRREEHDRMVAGQLELAAHMEARRVKPPTLSPTISKATLEQHRAFWDRIATDAGEPLLEGIDLDTAMRISALAEREWISKGHTHIPSAQELTDHLLAIGEHFRTAASVTIEHLDANEALRMFAAGELLTARDMASRLKEVGWDISAEDLTATGPNTLQADGLPRVVIDGMEGEFFSVPRVLWWHEGWSLGLDDLVRPSASHDHA